MPGRDWSGVLLLMALLGGQLGGLGSPVRAEDPQRFEDMAPSIGRYLEREYYDPSRFAAHLMVDHALRQLRIQENRIMTTWQGDVITLTVDTISKAIPAPEPHSLAQAMALIEQVRVAVDQSGFKPTRARELDYILINGALRCLDPHTMLMAPESAKDFKEEIDGEIYGIGAFLTQERGSIVIEHVIPGLPGQRAGLQDGDIVLGIDGERTAGLRLSQAKRRIKGPKGSSVVLTIERRGVDHPIELPVIRDLVQVLTMRSYRSGDVGYVRMDEFNALAARDLYHAISNLRATAPLKALVLDLRANGGGLLDQARLISDLFLGKGEEIVRTVAISGAAQIYLSSARQMFDLPMVVLVSGGTASAAEILSGTLQANDRAVVIGTATYGKGSVQNVIDLSDGSRLKLTTQEYQLPGGASIQDIGVPPDILLRHIQREDGGIEFLPLSMSREVDEEFALRNSHRYQHAQAYELSWISSPVAPSAGSAERGSSYGKDFTPDQEALMVLDLLREAVAPPDFANGASLANLHHTARQYLLMQLRTPVARRRDSESLALADSLRALSPPITWGMAGAISAATAATLQGSYSGPAQVTAGSIVNLTFHLNNHGTAAIGRVYGVIQADKLSPFWQDEVIFGEVPAQHATTGTLSFKVPPRLYAGEERFTLELFHEGDDVTLGSIPVVLRIEAKPRPHFSYSWQLEGHSGDGQLKFDEQAVVQLTLRNDGEGPSEKVDLRVYKDNDPFVQLSEQQFAVPALAKDATIAVRLHLKVFREIKRAERIIPFTGSSIHLQIRAEEQFAENVNGLYRATIANTLMIPINAPANPRQVFAPFLALVSVVSVVSDGPQVATVTVKVSDDNLRCLDLFQNDDKIGLVPASRIVQGIYTTRIALQTGANALRFLAIDQDGVEQVLPVRLWGMGETRHAGLLVGKK